MILVLDFGSQYTQLIARRIRESKVYCEIHPFNVSLDKINALRPDGIILSGGPASVYQDNSPRVAPELFDLPVPFLGICYGMGLVNLMFGGEAARADRREYGPAELIVDDGGDATLLVHKGVECEGNKRVPEFNPVDEPEEWESFSTSCVRRLRATRSAGPASPKTSRAFPRRRPLASIGSIR